MGEKIKQEWFRDGIRDAKSDRLPGTLFRWGPGVSLASGADLKREGYITPVAEDDMFLVGNPFEPVVRAIEQGKPSGVPSGLWLRQIYDLGMTGNIQVRLGERDDPLSALANIEDAESALRFANRFGFPVQIPMGLFQAGMVEEVEGQPLLPFVIIRPLASVEHVMKEAAFIRSVSRLRDGIRGAKIPSDELRTIGLLVSHFANQEHLPQLTLEVSRRLFSGGPMYTPTLKDVWDSAMMVAEARCCRLCLAQGPLTELVPTFTPQNIIGLIYWMLRRVLVGNGVAPKRCQNSKCRQIFTASRSSVKYCSEFCRRQVADDRRAMRRASGNNS